jgi:phasin
LTNAQTGSGAPVRAVTVYALARTNLMSQDSHTASHSRHKPSKPEKSRFELPKVEIPAEFRDMADKSVSQVKETYEKLKSVAEDATDVIEDSFATARKGASELGLKMIEVARENSNSTFDFVTKLLNAKSLSEAVELSTAQTRKQYEAMKAQTKDLTTIARKVAADTAEPVRESLSKVFVMKS